MNTLITIDIVRAPGFASSALSNPVVIPGNVERAYNIYQQTGGSGLGHLLSPTNFRGTPVAPDSNVMMNEEASRHHARMPTLLNVIPD